MQAVGGRLGSSGSTGIRDQHYLEDTGAHLNTALHSDQQAALETNSSQ